MECPLCHQKKNRQARNMECCPNCAYHIGLVWALWDAGKDARQYLRQFPIDTALGIASYAAQHYKRNS